MNKFKGWIQNKPEFIQVVISSTIAALILSLGVFLLANGSFLIQIAGMMVLIYPIRRWADQVLKN